MLFLLHTSAVSLLFALTCIAVPLRAQHTQDILVSSRNSDEILRYDGDTGAFVDEFVEARAGGLRAPQEVRYGQNGNLLVSGRGNTAILEFDGQTGTFIGEFTSGYALDGPTKMSFGPDGNLYVSQWGTPPTSGPNHKLVRFDGTTGAFIDEFTSNELAAGMDHLWHGDSLLYVLSYIDANVQRYDAQTGEFVDILVDSNLTGPTNLWFGDEGDLYVVDWASGTVERFDGVTGAFIGTFLEGLTNAEGFLFDNANRLYIGDWTDNVVRRYDAKTGDFIDVFIQGSRLQAPNSLAYMEADSVPNEESPAPTPIQLNQSRPNPASGPATIEYSLGAGNDVSLKIYDVLGREVATLVEVFRPAGTHTISLERSTLPAGFYIYRLAAGGYVESHRLTLTR